jgi:uncharacterized membrane protein YecN with MAPEG domain
MTTLSEQEDAWAMPGTGRWVLWLLGIALLAAVVAAAVAISLEGRLMSAAWRCGLA